MKTCQVFVSHTSDMAAFPEARSFVQATLDAVNRAGMAAVDMRYFAAREGRPADYCRQRVRDCEIYVAVIGFMYGSIVPEEAISYTELEFEEAGAAGIPRLVFLLDPNADLPDHLIDSDRHLVDRFRRWLLQAGLTVRFFTSDSGLELEVFHALSEAGTGGPASVPRQWSADMHQRDDKIAIAHSGTGDIVVSIGVSPPAVGIPGLLGVSGSASLAASGPHTLPRDIRGFTGRRDEVEALVEAIGQAAQTGVPVVIHSIEGMAGVGKTALAVHAAHRLAPQFPDGQLFVRLNAHTSGTGPIEPGEALTALLRETGMDPREIPDSLEGKESLWRHRLAGRRFLLLLDDAANHDQVRPLLPGTGSSAVLVTSRRRLEEFGGDVRIELDVLPSDDAIHLFTRLSGRLDSDSKAAAELVTLAGRLPLAIQILAGRLRSRPRWFVADLVAELAAARDRSSEIGALDVPVSASFDLSYNLLSADRKQFFRRLGLHPGSDIDAYAAAAIAGTGIDKARRELDALYADHLIDEPIRYRYRFHDLISDYARALAATDPVQDQNEAVRRLCDYYLYAAQAADRLLARRPPTQRMSRVSRPGYVPEVSSYAQAARWMEVERANLHVTALYCASRNLPIHAADIPAAMAASLRAADHWSQAEALHKVALRVADDVGDRLGEANALNELGIIQYLTDRYAEAAATQEKALELYRALGNRLGEANALNELGIIQYLTDRYAEAAATQEKALELYRALGNRLGEANALNELGIIQRLTDRYAEAAATQEKALELYRALGNQFGEANALIVQSVAKYQQDHYADAAVGLARALELYRALGQRLGQANALIELGVVQYLMGQSTEAIASLTEALELYRALGSRLGQANALNELGIAQRMLDRFPEAATSHEKALELYRALRNQLGQANALNEMGNIQNLTANYADAAASHAEALELYRSLRDRLGESETLNSLGELSLNSSRVVEAQDQHRRALVIAREVGSRRQEARALEGLGRCLLQDAQLKEGGTILRQALAIYAKLASPNARRVEHVMREYGVE
jgi:tetratricopeptide (TPR) repeat protein